MYLLELGRNGYRKKGRKTRRISEISGNAVRISDIPEPLLRAQCLLSSRKVCKGRPALLRTVPIDGLTAPEFPSMNASHAAHLLPPFVLRFMHFFNLKRK